MEYNPQEISQLVEAALEYYQRKAQVADKYAAKTRAEIQALAKQENQDKINYLEHKLTLVYGSFNFSAEQERWHEFQRQHDSCRATYKINSGKMPYVIPYGTGIGTIFTAVCPVCGEKKDISYSEGW